VPAGAGPLQTATFIDAVDLHLRRTVCYRLWVPAVAGIVLAAWLALQSQSCTLTVDSHRLGDLARLSAGRVALLDAILQAHPAQCPAWHSWAAVRRLFIARRPLCLRVIKPDTATDIRPLVAATDYRNGCGLFRSRRNVKGVVHTVSLFAYMPYELRMPRRSETGSIATPFTRCGTLLDTPPDMAAGSCDVLLEPGERVRPLIFIAEESGAPGVDNRRLPWRFEGDAGVLIAACVCVLGYLAVQEVTRCVRILRTQQQRADDWQRLTAMAQREDLRVPLFDLPGALELRQESDATILRSNMAVLRVIGILRSTAAATLRQDTAARLPRAVLTETSLAALQGDGERTACVICWEEFSVCDEVTTLSCHGTHVFHRQCICRWVVECSATCPKCRARVEVEDQHDPPWGLPVISAAPDPHAAGAEHADAEEEAEDDLL